VVILDTVTVIDGAFKGLKELTQITLPKNFKLIMSDSFEYSGITSIVIPEGVTDIGNDALVLIFLNLSAMFIFIDFFYRLNNTFIQALFSFRSPKP
jgi:hypothetical protein